MSIIIEGEKKKRKKNLQEEQLEYAKLTKKNKPLNVLMRLKRTNYKLNLDKKKQTNYKKTSIHLV